MVSRLEIAFIVVSAMLTSSPCQHTYMSGKWHLGFEQSQRQRANNVIIEPEGVTAYPVKPRYIKQTTGAGGGS